MQVQINADHSIRRGEALEAWVVSVVESALVHAGAHITRIEVHLGDENGRKGGQNDKRCMMEARLEGRQPIAVTEHAATLELAVNGAAGKLARMVNGIIGRASDTIAASGRIPVRGAQEDR